MADISWLDQVAGRELIGGKGANLAELRLAGFPVPHGFVVTTEAYRHYLSANDLDAALAEALAAGDGPAVRSLFEAPLPEDLARELVEAWRQLGGVPVAVRSSSSAEDQAEASFAGQQDSFLNIHGEQELCEAVRRCFASLWNDRAIDYRSRHGIDQASVALAVVVQQMVEATAAGVMFTANPLNGHLDETVVTATWGLGEQAAQGGAADTLVLRGGQVVERTVVEKSVRTQSQPETSGTVDLDVEVGQRDRQALTDEQARELASLGGRVEAHFGLPQDIEWVVAGDQLSLVQARPITALAHEVGEVPQDWPVDDEKAMYVRASIVDLMPDPLSPLFADLVRPAVPRGLLRALEQLHSESALHPEDVDFPTVNGYAYYYFSREGMLRMLKQAPKSLAALGGRSQFDDEDLWARVHPAYRAVVDEWSERALDELDSTELLAGVRELLDAGCAYYGAVQSLVPLASSAELPFTRLYSSLAKQAGGPAAATFLQGFESRSVQVERSLWALAQWCRQSPELCEALLARRSWEGLPGAVGFRRRLDGHLAQYGHITANLDLAVPTSLEDPTQVLETLRQRLGDSVPDPDELLDRQTAEREKAEVELFERLDPARKAILQPLLAKAQRVGPVREDALADVGLAWPQMRRMLGLLGQRLVAAGACGSPDDLYWLQLDELTVLCQALDERARQGAGEPEGNAPTTTLGDAEQLASTVEQRKVQWRGQRAAEPPQFLPRNAWYKMFHRLVPGMEAQQKGPVIQGLGVSKGRITGPARVVRGPEDFDRMRPGEVLVSPITTPAWTPLFAMASAVVTDVGGPLSHSSIVAREYEIPAVLGTGIATRRIVDGMVVTVDADRGTVTLPEGEAPVETGFKPKVPYKFALGAAAAAALLVRKML